MCNHNFKTYIGFTDTFDYCSVCNLKKTEIEATNDNPWWKGSTEDAAKVLIDVAKEVATSAGFSAWLPESKPEAMLKAYRDAAVYGTGVLYVTQNEFKYLSPWYDLSNLQEEINRCSANIQKNQAEMAVPKLFVSNVDKEKGVVTYSTPSGLFGLDRTDYNLWTKNVYIDECSPEEADGYGINKFEFTNAVKKAFPASWESLADKIWAEIEADFNGEPEDD